MATIYTGGRFQLCLAQNLRRKNNDNDQCNTSVECTLAVFPLDSLGCCTLNNFQLCHRQLNLCCFLRVLVSKVLRTRNRKASQEAYQEDRKYVMNGCGAAALKAPDGSLASAKCED